MTDCELIAACDRIVSAASCRDSEAVAKALMAILYAGGNIGERPEDTPPTGVMQRTGRLGALAKHAYGNHPDQSGEMPARQHQIPRKGPRMSAERADPQAQIERWLRQYLAHMKAPEIARQVNLPVAFRFARTMIEQGKTLDDFENILRELVKEGTKPKGIGWLITVIEGRLGKVA